MADLEDVTLDGRPLQSLRVADLKAALEERGLSKSGQKNALVKRLKGALMLENLQKTSTAHVGLQPNSQIGEEMSQNSFIKQYLAKQQELLRQRLEREAREAYDTNDQEDHTEVNNSVCPPQVPDASTAVTDHFKPPGPSSGQAAPMALSHRHPEAAMSRPLPSASAAQDNRGEAAADSDDDDSEDGDDDGDDEDDWDNNVERRLPRQPVRPPLARERSAAPCQPQQQHIPSVLSPQLRQPTPPPSPPPELSFPLPDTPKQSPPSPDVAAGGRSPSSSSSGSSSSGSRSSSPEPHGHAERKPGPLTLLARKMEKEGAFSGAPEWHCRDANRQGISSSSTFPNKVRPEGLMGSLPLMLSTTHAPINLGAAQGLSQVPVLKPTAERDAELERSLEFQRQAQLRKHEQERAMEEERVRVALEREQQKALEKEQFEREQALERARLERELALNREREEKEKALALERQRSLERELALQNEREERERRQMEEHEKAMELERARILERERAREQERLERERALEAERLERERKERERALEQERLEREAALQREKLEREKERLEREKALEQERIERERIEHLRALERERIEREQERIKRQKALEQERIERENARIEQERFEREKALEQERIERENARIEQERLQKEKALEQERLAREKALEQERLAREKAFEQERLEREKALEQERLEKEKALEQERLEREKALEQMRLEQEKLERERALELERIEREKASEQERIAREKAQIELDRIKREKALEQERIEQEKVEREKALERERIEREKALEREKIERERIEKERLEREKNERERALELEQREKERALEQQRLDLENKENERIQKERALEQERIEREKAKEQKEKVEREATLERERLEKAEQERLELEKAQERKRQALEEERKAKENALVLERQRLPEQVSVEKKQATQEGNAANESRMADVESKDHLTPSREIGFVPLPTPPPLFTGTSRKATEAGKQEGEVHGPVPCEGQAEESNTPKSPQPVFKKFRFTRETPLQPPTASRVIKRPRAFSDTPQPCISVMPAVNADGQRQKEQSADPEAVSGKLIPDVNQVDAVESAKKDATNFTERKEELAKNDKNEAAVKKSILTAVEDRVVCPSNQVGASGRGRNVKKKEKRGSRRSSNDSSSSESDSSSSPSTDSSSSSREKTYTSRLCRDEEKASPQSTENAKAQKSRSPAKLENSSVNKHVNEGLLTKLNDASSRDAHQTRKGSEDDEEKPENSCDGESSVSEPEKCIEANNEMPKAFSTRKISLSSSKSSPGSTENDHESGTAGGRKRRWGSSTAVTAKKPSISITTDSLKSLIPDIKPALNQEAVMELHAEEPVLSEPEEEEKDHADQELQIRRTVTQIVHVENQQDGQTEAKRRRAESEEEDTPDEKEMKISDENQTYTRAIETHSPVHICHEADINSVAQGEIIIRRSISQQKTGVSITIDDPVRTARQPSPPRGNTSNIVHVCNLVRPFTLGQLKELLGRTGTLVEDGFWIDKIKSHCYVTYSSPDEAVATRAALHGVKWPQSNPKVLSVDFCLQDELDFHKGLLTVDRAGMGMQPQGRNIPSLVPERDQWVEREREMERRERARAEREWDRDKVQFGKTPEQKEAGPRRSKSKERRRKEGEKTKEKKTEKKEKPEDPPAKLLDDLFRKTKAIPCIYWLPLTEEQHLQREAARVERRKEREIQRKKDEEAELKKKEENKERMKAAAVAGGGGGGGGVGVGAGVGGGPTVDGRSENEKMRDRDRAPRDRDRDRERDRDRDREADKRRDGYRRPAVAAAPGGRRSRSRSDPRERRR